MQVTLRSTLYASNLKSRDSYLSSSDDNRSNTSTHFTEHRLSCIDREVVEPLLEQNIKYYCQTYDICCQTYDIRQYSKPKRYSLKRTLSVRQGY